MGKVAPDLRGNRYGKLVVLWVSGRIKGRSAWVCRCDCGVERVVRADKLVCGKATSCAGDCRYTNRGFGGRKHVSERRSFEAMWSRCSDRKHLRYRDYGGRGIRVCRRWKLFKVFLADMGPKPTPGHTLDRIDNDGNYEPGNCRWATRDEQRRNMRSNVYVEYEGRRMLLLDVIAETGISASVVRGRIANGWALSDAISVPVRPKRRRAAA